MKIKYNAHRTAIYIILSVLSLLTLRCAVSPSPVFQKDGRLYGKIEGQWGGRWWNYYQRGISYAQGSFWDFATKDLKEAIKQRDRDQRRARTYGLHILENYFPHRELGIVYYNQGMFERAIFELETSLSQFESAKAKYFLNLARQGFLKETGIDQHPPSIIISYPESGSLTRYSSLVLRGQAIDDQFVGSIYINNRRIPIELSNPFIAFEPEIALDDGENNLLIEAVDLVGKKTKKEIAIWCDQEAPLIYIDRVVKGTLKNEYIIKGYITDRNGGIDGLWLNDRHINLNKGKEEVFSAYLYVNDLRRPVIYKAKDILGNLTTGEFYISEFFDTPPSYGFALQRLAYSGPVLSGFSANEKNSLNDKETQDKALPIIDLKDIPDTLTVDWDECFLEGKVYDSEGVNSISVNGKELIYRTARIVCFNSLVPLAAGDNLITIKAKNLSGRQSTKQLHIIKKKNPVHEIGTRWTIAILPFEFSGDRAELRDLVYDSLIRGFIAHSRFQVVDRERIAGILNSMKGIRENVNELGKLASAEGIIVGKAYYYNEYLELIARVIDTESTIILDSEEVFGPVGALDDISLLTDGLSLKFKQAFPIVEGQVINIDSESVQIDLSRKDKVIPNMKVVFFREGDPIKLPGTEKILEKRIIILGEGKITNIFSSYSDSTILMKKKTKEIRLKDLVITK